MKQFRTILAMFLLGAGLVACESMKLGDAGLSSAPEASGATIDTLFASLKDADKVLASAYYYLPYGMVTDFDSKMGGEQLESLTDHYVSNKRTSSAGPTLLYYNGSLSAGTSKRSSMTFNFGGHYDADDERADDCHYYAIRYSIVFLQNADKIPNADPAEIARKKAEARMCQAVAYSDMLRYVGGVPIMDHIITDPREEMKFPRATFAQTVDYIVDLCDQAAADLPWTTSSNDDGRFTKAAALGLKLRVLLFAASPTFNSDKLWRSDANEYHCYTNYDAARWQRAKDAADEFMTAWAESLYYGLVEASSPSPSAYRLAYRKGYFERGTTETLISIRKSNSTSFHDEVYDNQHDYGSGGTLEYANKFGWADGTDFPEDYDWSVDPESMPPFFKAGVETRDPRLYETLCVPGDKWWNDKGGPVWIEADGRQVNNPGFLQMKYILQKKGDRTTLPHWCMMRLPEVLLSAAEAYNETDGGPDTNAYEWVNMVRRRVGLRDLPEGLSQEEFRNAVLRERECEFGFEEVRWFDMVRWGLTDAFTQKLHGLTSHAPGVKVDATSFTFEVNDVYPSRSWWTNWDTKWYLAPIPTEEVNKGYGMTQNPGW